MPTITPEVQANITEAARNTLTDLGIPIPVATAAVQSGDEVKSESGDAAALQSEIIPNPAGGRRRTKRKQQKKGKSAKKGGKKHRKSSGKKSRRSSSKKSRRQGRK
jgi:hypothetical protein